MAVLKDILYKVALLEVSGNMETLVKGVQFDSRKVTVGDSFVAVSGSRVDGHDFIDEVVSKGAAVVVCEKMPKNTIEDVAYIRVENSAMALGTIASNYHGRPSSQLTIVGVTGTNGKTTVATLLYNLFTKLGYSSGLISTVENRVGEKVKPATHTTPDALQLHSLFKEMVKSGCTHCFMEVSSHALHQSRVEGVEFDGAIFTNISHDHLDYHGSFDEYIKAKKTLFDGLPRSAFGLINVDDKRGKVMLQNSKAQKRTFSLKNISDYKGKVLSNTFEGLEMKIAEKEVWFKLIGDFNALNILAVFASAIELGEAEEDVLTTLSEVMAAPGRFEQVFNDMDILAIVDYAHTPDALKNVLKTIDSIRTGNEQVITIIGCGGDRDTEKRPIMADVACQLSDKVILTSDNPRSESPEKIIEDMMTGVKPLHFKKTIKVTDREEAIKTACMMANLKDIILVAGKGHETYQEINGERLPFDDKEVLQRMLELTKN